MTNLLDIADLGGREGIEDVLRLTDAFVEVSNRPIPKVPALRGKTVGWLFYEDSTRTRLSFETAAKRLSADTANFSTSSSSVNKGESLRDTARVVEAMGVDAIVVRHRSSGAPHRIAQWVDAAVVNAGDGWHQHPTQALLDCYTLRQHVGALDGKRIVIVGDVKHSQRGALRRRGVHGAGRAGRPRGPAHAAAAEPGGLAGRGDLRSRRRARWTPTSSTPCACSASA